MAGPLSGIQDESGGIPCINENTDSIYIEGNPSLPGKIGTLAYKILVGVCLAAAAASLIAAVVLSVPFISWVAIPCCIGVILFELKVQRIDEQNLCSELRGCSATQRCEKQSVEWLLSKGLISPEEVLEYCDTLSFDGLQQRVPPNVMRQYPAIFERDQVWRIWQRVVSELHSSRGDEILDFCDQQTRFLDQECIQGLRECAYVKNREFCQTQPLPLALPSEQQLMRSYNLTQAQAKVQTAFFNEWKAIDFVYRTNLENVHRKVQPTQHFESKLDEREKGELLTPRDCRDLYEQQFSQLKKKQSEGAYIDMYLPPEQMLRQEMLHTLRSGNINHLHTVLTEWSIRELYGQDEHGRVSMEDIIANFGPKKNNFPLKFQYWTIRMLDLVQNVMDFTGYNEAAFKKQMQEWIAEQFFIVGAICAIQIQRINHQAFCFELQQLSLGERLDHHSAEWLVDNGLLAPAEFQKLAFASEFSKLIQTFPLSLLQKNPGIFEKNAVIECWSHAANCLDPQLHEEIFAFLKTLSDSHWNELAESLLPIAQNKYRQYIQMSPVPAQLLPLDELEKKSGYVIPVLAYLEEQHRLHKTYQNGLALVKRNGILGMQDVAPYRAKCVVLRNQYENDFQNLKSRNREGKLLYLSPSQMWTVECKEKLQSGKAFDFLEVVSQFSVFDLLTQCEITQQELIDAFSKLCHAYKDYREDSCLFQIFEAMDFTDCEDTLCQRLIAVLGQGLFLQTQSWRCEFISQSDQLKIQKWFKIGLISQNQMVQATQKLTAPFWPTDWQEWQAPR